MELSRLASGGTPLVMNVMVQGAAVIPDGAQIAASELTTTAQGATISATTTTGAGDDVIGFTQVSTSQASAAVGQLTAMNAYRFNLESDGIPNKGTGSTASGGMDWVPTCVTPDALYNAYHSVTASADTASDAVVVGITALTTTNVTITLTSSAGHAGGWLMDGGGNSSAGGTPTYTGQLRFCSATSASIEWTLLTAMNTSVDSNLVWASPQTYAHTLLSSDGSQLRGKSGTAGTPRYDQGMVIIENYVIHSAAPLHPLRQWVDDGLNGLSRQRLYTEVRQRKFYKA